MRSRLVMVRVAAVECLSVLEPQARRCCKLVQVLRAQAATCWYVVVRQLPVREVAWTFAVAKARK